MSQLSVINQVCQVINTPEQKKKYEAVLPANMSVEKFTRTAITAIQNNPELVDADRDSLYTAVMMAAQDNLLPDGREGVLNIFKTKVSRDGKDVWIKKVQWMPMVRGIIKTLADAGFSVDGQIVCDGDKFDYQLGDNPFITHSPPQFGQARGEMIGCYAIATDVNGSKYRAVMDKLEVEKIRAASKSGEYGPWKTWYNEMAIKSVIKRLAKRLPISSRKAFDVLDRDDDDAVDMAPAPAATQAPVQSSRLAVVAAQAPVTEAIEGDFQEVPGSTDLNETGAGQHDDPI